MERTLKNKTMEQQGKHTPKNGTLESGEYLRLLCVDHTHAIAVIIWDTLEHHDYVIVKKSERDELLARLKELQEIDIKWKRQIELKDLRNAELSAKVDRLEKALEKSLDLLVKQGALDILTPFARDLVLKQVDNFLCEHDPNLISLIQKQP